MVTQQGCAAGGTGAMSKMSIRGVSLYVDVVGHGDPLLLMHGGPGLDHVSLTPFRRLADRHTLIFYDHRCNGRSTGAPVTSMTWENLTADADALREADGGRVARLGQGLPHRDQALELLVVVVDPLRRRV